MKKRFTTCLKILPIICINSCLFAQNTDSILLGQINNLTILEKETDDNISDEYTPPMLHSGKNMIQNALSFGFFPVRYRARNYEQNYNKAYINFIPINTIDNYSIPFSIYYGLNNSLRGLEYASSLNANNFTFGNIGYHNNFDISAGNKRPFTQITYANTNKALNNKLGYIYNSGFRKNGIAVSIAVNIRGSENGYIPGTYGFNPGIYFALDKKIQNHTLSFALFNVYSSVAAKNASVKETYELTGNNLYNPSWGYSNQKRRNANIYTNYLPTIIVADHHRINNSVSMNYGITITKGYTSTSSLDWYNAPDPRPDYYKYLPSNYQNQDHYQYETLTNEYKNDPNLLQINWDQLYKINQSNKDQRALYILSERINQTKSINSVIQINARLYKNIQLTGGMTYQYQNNHQYRKIKDLLGGNFWVNINPFIEQNNPFNNDIIQNNLENKNEKIYRNVKYGYDYGLNIIENRQWIQLEIPVAKFTYNLSVEHFIHTIKRLGYYQNGLFPLNSKTISPTYSFENLNYKIGINYALNGRNYINLNYGNIHAPPNANSLFINANTRDITNKYIRNTTIQSGEISYIKNAPKLKLQINLYYTEIKNAYENRYFYDDYFNSFASYILNNITKTHYGTEFGLDYKITPNLSFSAVTAISNNQYSNNPNLTVSSENTIETLSNQEVFIKNLKIPGSPSKLYKISFQYSTGYKFSFNISGNYFQDRLATINPYRRTKLVLQDLNPITQSETIQNITKQEKLPNGFLLNSLISYSITIYKNKKAKTINFFLICNNILNKKDIISSSFEQMRMDLKSYDINKFPNKYNYAIGRNYYISTVITF